SWHGDVIVTLSPAVARRVRLHQGSAQSVLQISLQNAFLNQYCLVRGIAFVIDIQRSATKGYRSVINNSTQLRAHFLPHQTSKCRGLLSIEVRFEAVPNRFVQQNSRPTRGEHHLHGTGRSVNGAEL